MVESFHLKSPATQLAAELRRAIASGEISGSMPGLRKLMADFGVTRKVVEGAMAELIQSGDLKSHGPNKAMEPVRRRHPTHENQGGLLVTSRPFELRSGIHRELFLAIEAALPPPVTRLNIDAQNTPVEKVVRRILESDRQTIFILDHEGEVADRLAEAGRIVVATGMASPVKKVSHASVSHEMLVRGAVSRAFEAGHRRVCFVLWRRRPEVAARMRAWIADEYAKAGYRHTPDFDAPIVDDRNPEALHTCLRELVRHTPPTALIVSDFPQWIGTVMVLAQAGLRVPGDISLICLCSAPEWEAATPSQAHFAHPVAALAKAIRLALEAAVRGEPPEIITLAPEWVPGDSLAPPKK
jgi:DNA-binding LacI/PurR family transcriptional regulator